MALALAATARAAILVEASHPQQSRFLNLKDDVYQKIEKVIAEKNLGALNIKILKDSCPPNYDPKNPENRLCICTSRIDESSNTMTLEFRSPNNHFVLEFSNIDINDALSDIKIEPYLGEFLESLKDLALSPEDRKKSIQAGINKAAAALEITDVSTENDKITYTYKGKQNTIGYKLNEDLVEFNTDFFQDTIDLNIPQKQFIEFEIEKTMKEVFDHLFGIQRFTLGDGETAAQSIKTLDCNKLIKDPDMLKAFEKRMTDSQLEFDGQGDVISVSNGAQKVTISCKPIPIGDFSLLEVNADFSAVSPLIESSIQTYPEKSLYNLQPVSVAYFHDLGKRIVELLADFNKADNFEPIDNEGAGVSGL